MSVSGTGSVGGTVRPGGVTGRDAGRCVAVAGLVGLAPDQQAAMMTLCERRGRPQAEHAPLVARLAARASWEASALAELLAGGAPHVDIGGEAGATARLLAARRALAGLDERRLARMYGVDPDAALDNIVVIALALRYAGRQLPREVILDAWPGNPSLINRLLGPAWISDA